MKVMNNVIVHDLLIPVSKDQHLIVIHESREEEFVPNDVFMWKSHETTGDYYHQMNQQNYEK
jgi:hypothetical protein